MRLRNKFLLLVLMSFCLVLCLVSCTDSNAVVKISFEDSEYCIKTDQTIDLNVNINPGSLYTQEEIENNLEFTSSDESVASFVNGKLKGVGYGETTITVEWKDKPICHDVAKVIVGLGELPEVVFPEDFKFNMEKTTKQQFNYSLSFDSEYVSVSWKELNPTIATIKNDEIVALSPGEAVFKATITDGVFTCEKEYIIKVLETDFVINYDLKGGVNNVNNPDGYNSLLTPIELHEATREGYTFEGWLLNDNKVTELAVGTTGNVDLVASWSPIKYTIEYELNGGNHENETEFTILDEVKLNDASKEGYTFKGWFKDGEKVEKIEIGTVGNIKLVAKFDVVTYSINYELNGGEFLGIYSSREEMVNDFMNDFGTFAGITMTTPAQYWSHSSKTAFWKDATMRAKWAWMPATLAKYAKAQGQDDQYLKALASLDGTVSSYATQNVAIYLLGINNAIWNEQYKDNYNGLSSKWTTVDCTSDEVKESYPSLSTSYDVSKEVTLIAPTKSYYDFVGWYEGDVKVESIALGSFGNKTLVAKYTPTQYTITYDANGGTLGDTKNTYTVEEEVVLCVATKEGAKFIGWYNGEDKIEKIEVGSHGNITLVAKYEGYPITIGTIGYETLDEAINASKEGDVINMIAGNYDLSVVINKSLELVGASKETTIINVNKDVAGNINGDRITFKSVSLVGAGGGAVSGVSFQAGVNAHYLSFIDCIIKETNTFVKFVTTTTNNPEILVKDCEISRIGQFAMWITNNIDKLTFTDSTIDASSCGSVVNANAALFRIRSGEAVFYNNEFIGDTKSIDGLFESGSNSKGVTVKYNTFKDVTKYVHINDGKTIVFDENLYLDGETPLLAVPSSVSGNGVTADKELASSETDRVSRYQLAMLKAPITFVVDQDVVLVDAPEYYLQTIGLEVLPTPVKEGFVFVGWLLNDQIVESISKEVTGPITLAAKFEEEVSVKPVLIGEVGYSSIEEALEAVKEGETITLSAGLYEGDIEINVKNVTLAGPNKGIKWNETRAEEAEIKGFITINASGVTIDGIKYSGTNYILLGKVDNITLQNINSVAIPDYTKKNGDGSGTGRASVIGNLEGCNNVVIKDSSFETQKESIYGKNMITMYGNVENITISGCLFKHNNENSSSSIINEAIRIDNISGEINILNNIIVYPTDNYAFTLGETSNNATKVNVFDNKIAENPHDTLNRYACGLRVSKLKSGSVTTFRGNDFVNVAGGTFNFRDSEAGAVIIMMYNNFDDKTQFKITSTNRGAATYEFENNYYGTIINSSSNVIPTDHGVLKTLEEMELLYVDYMTPKPEYPLTIDLDGGSFPVIEYTTREQIMNDFLSDFEKYLSGIAGKAIAISRVNQTDHTTDFFGITYNYANDVEKFFSKEEYKRWAWVLEFLVNNGGDKSTTVLLRANLNAIIYQNKHNSWPYSADFSSVTFDVIKDLVSAPLPYTAPTKYVVETGLEILTPVKEGYTFVGWICGNDVIDKISAGTLGKLALKAKWEKVIIKHNIDFVLGAGGQLNSDVTTFVEEEGLATLPTPTRSGYTFLGWGLNIDDTEYVTSIKPNTKEDVTLYAIWSDNNVEYKVTYVLNGGNTLYKNRDELIEDLLLDLTTITEKSITKSNFTASCRQGEFDKFIKNDKMWAKWKFLFEFFKSINPNSNSPVIYEEVLTSRTCSGTYWWFLTRDFAGFVNGTIANFYYSVGPIDFTVYANADGFWNKVGKDVTDDKAKTATLLVPYRPYYSFVGWYKNSEFSGDKVEFLDGDCTLYAKWEKATHKLTYDLDNDDASLTNLVVDVHAGDSFDVEMPTYDERYWKFNGWFAEKEFVNRVTRIEEYMNEDKVIYASWTEIQGYTIKYELNTGSILYADRESVVADLLKDYNYACGHSYTSADEVPTGAWNDIDWHTFFTKTTESGVSVYEKWVWLAQYIYDVSVLDVKSNNCNVSGMKCIVEKKAPSGDPVYGVSYAMRGFITGTVIRPNSGYESANFNTYERQNGFWPYLNKVEKTEYLNNKGTVTLPLAYKEDYKFVGWFDNASFEGDPIVEVTDNGEDYHLYAKFVEAIPVESVEFTNAVTELKRFSTYQLEWKINPSNANITAVRFTSSDSKIAKVSSTGLIETLADGTVTITMTSLSPTGASVAMTFNVFAPDHFESSYETNSYLSIGENVKLIANYVKRDGSSSVYTWTTLNPEIASVENGIVTGISAGLATIRVNVTESIYFDFIVTVLENDISNELRHAVEANNSTVFTRYELGIGAGSPAYYRDIIGSVSQLLYNYKYDINREFEEQQAQNGNNHSGTRKSTEFITVHYTGNMGPGSTARANAQYFARPDNTGSSIHYTTGNDGIFHVLDDSLIGWHASDGASTNFEWIPTGVKYNATDPLFPVIDISSNSKFTINGEETTCTVPVYKGKGGLDNIVVTSNEHPLGNGLKCINQQSLAHKIVNGEYYLGTYRWSFADTVHGYICSTGGNARSIGIESCVNIDSDLWYTWQITAQLVAHLLLEWNLDITRVRGHHFYAGKDCPQPLLANNNEIWIIFLDMIQRELDTITTYKDVKYSMTVNEEDQAIVDAHGRVTPSEFAKVITYTVTVVNGESTETVTLASCVNGIYSECLC